MSEKIREVVDNHSQKEQIWRVHEQKYQQLISCLQNKIKQLEGNPS